MSVGFSSSAHAQHHASLSHPAARCHAAHLRPPPPGLQILKVDLERKAIIVKGSVPGKAGNVLQITPAKIVGTNC